jgi:hypothetical protein
MRHFAVIGAVVVLSASSAIAAPTCDNMQGAWVNQLGSTLNIQAINSATGAITGSYISPSGGGTTTYPLAGWINSKDPVSGQNNVKVISFTVRWGTIGSITSWTGYCQTVNGAPKLTTLWHLVRPNSSFEWDHILTNTDVFTPAP